MPLIRPVVSHDVDDNEVENDKVEDNKKDNDNKKENNNKDNHDDKGISALELDRNRGFLWGHRGYQGNWPHDDDNKKDEDEVHQGHWR